MTASRSRQSISTSSPYGCLLPHRAFGVDDATRTDTRGIGGVHVDDEDLVAPCVGAGTDQLHLAVAGRRQGGLDDQFGTEPRQLAHRLWEGSVVADRQADPADAGNVEHDELVAGRCLFVGLPREHLAVGGGDLAERRHGNRGVVDVPVVAALVETAGHQPQAGLLRQPAHPVGRGAGDRLGHLGHPVGARLQQWGLCGKHQFWHNDEFDAWEGVADRADVGLEAVPAGGGVERNRSRLDGGDGECAHDQASLSVTV